MPRKYVTFGLKAENNLSDVPNKNSALTNLLNNLADAAETFVADDIKVINGLAVSEVTTEDIEELNGLVSTYIDSNDNITKDIVPRITLQDQISYAKGFLGDPPLLRGGDGLNTIFVPSTDIANTSSISSTTLGNELITSTSNAIGPVFFWNDGKFYLSDKLHPNFEDTFGLIQWEGYLDGEMSSPIVESSSLFLIEQDIEANNNWEIIHSVYSETREIEFNSASANTISTVFVGDSIKYLCVGDTLLYANGEFSDTQVIEVDVISQEVTFSDTITVSSGNNSISVGFVPGTDTLSLDFRLKRLYKYDKNKIRITIWYPEREEQYALKYFFFRPGPELTFARLYSEYTNSPSTNVSDYQYFVENRLSGLKSDGTGNIQSNKLVYANYTPPKLLSEKIPFTSPKTVTHTGKGNLEASSSTFTNIDVGDFFVIDPASSNTHFDRFFEIISPTSAFTNPKTDEFILNADVDIIFVKATGLIGIYKSSSNILEVIPSYSSSDYSSLSRIKNDYLIASTSDTNFLRITNFDSSNNEVTTADISGGVDTLGDGVVFVYANKGLIDRSGESLCEGVFGVELATAASSTNTLVITDDSQITTTPKLYVQFGDIISANDDIYISSHNPATKEIVLSASFVGDLDVGTTITLVKEANWVSGENREFCVLPLNTAPPFEGTATGLKTTASYPDLKTNTLAFRDLILTVANTDIEETSNTTYSETINVMYRETVTYNSPSANTVSEIIVDDADLIFVNDIVYVNGALSANVESSNTSSDVITFDGNITLVSGDNTLEFERTYKLLML